MKSFQLTILEIHIFARTLVLRTRVLAPVSIPVRLVHAPVFYKALMPCDFCVLLTVSVLVRRCRTMYRQANFLTYHPYGESSRPSSATVMSNSVVQNLCVLLFRS